MILLVEFPPQRRPRSQQEQRHEEKRKILRAKVYCYPVFYRYCITTSFLLLYCILQVLHYNIILTVVLHFTGTASQYQEEKKMTMTSSVENHVDFVVSNF
jgi:hypothetical protein